MRSKNIVRLLSCLLPAAALALTACSEDPTASGTGTPARIELSRNTTFQEVGRQATVSAWVRDAAGNRLSEAVTAVANGSGVTIDSLIFHPETSESRIFITPTAIDTTAFVVVTAGSLSDTVYVSALPASLRITLADSIGSGATLTPTVTGLSATGATLGTVKYSVSSSDQTKVVVNANGSITARGTGLATLTFTGPGGKVTATKDIRVVPGAFLGTATAAPFSGGQSVTFTAPAGVKFDGDTNVSFTGQEDPGFVVSLSADSSQLVVTVPFGVPAGTTAFSLTNVGPNQLALVGTVNLGAESAGNDTYEPASDDPLTAPAVTPGTDLYGSLSTSDADDFYTLTVTTAAKFRLQLDWTDSGTDNDMYLLNAAGTLSRCADDFLGCAAGTGARPEIGTTGTLAPGIYRVYVNLYDVSGTRTNYRLRVTQLP